MNSYRPRVRGALCRVHCCTRARCSSLISSFAETATLVKCKRGFAFTAWCRKDGRISWNQLAHPREAASYADAKDPGAHACRRWRRSGPYFLTSRARSRGCWSSYCSCLSRERSGRRWNCPSWRPPPECRQRACALMVHGKIEKGGGEQGTGFPRSGSRRPEVCNNANAR